MRIVEVEGMMPQPGWETSKILDDRTVGVKKHEYVSTTKKSFSLFIIVLALHFVSVSRLLHTSPKDEPPYQYCSAQLLSVL